MAGQEEKKIKHYSSSHKILLVGEGDFSFAACLAKAFGVAFNIIATSLDSEEELRTKYPNVEANLAELKNRGSTIIHKVDAWTMSEHPSLKYMLFDRIVFNFPHAGFHYRAEHDRSQIDLHQKVVRGFFENARHMVSVGGQVHVTHKTAHPFSQWKIEQLAEEASLMLMEEDHFCQSEYPGYVNRKGAGSPTPYFSTKSNDTFPVGACSTFKFIRC